MTTITARNESRINVWETSQQAQAAHVDQVDEVFNRMTIYRSVQEAQQYTSYEQDEGGESYTGPLDLVGGALFAYSQRAMIAGSTVNAIRLINDDDEEQDFALVSNAVDSTAVGTFKGAGDAFGMKWYDQSGNGHHGIAKSAPQRPIWTGSSANGKPAFAFDSADSDGLATAGDVTIPAGGITAFAVFKITGVSSACGFFGIDINTYFPQAFGLSVKNLESVQAEVYQEPDSGGGVSSTSASFNGTYAVLQIKWDYGVWSAKINGSVLTKATDFDAEGVVSAVIGRMGIGCTDATSDIGNFSGEIIELIAYSGLMADGNFNAIAANQAAYYGITL